jgi:hypothetical protein
LNSRDYAGRTPKEFLEKMNHVFKKDGSQACKESHQHSKPDEP